MKKVLLVLFLGVIAWANVNAQWVETSLEFTSPGTSYTKFQFAEHTWAGSHAILFNAYKSVSVNGSFLSTGNTKYANSVGSYAGGAGSIVFNGNGGAMHFLVSPASTGINNDINWGGSKMTILRDGNIGIGTTSPISQFHVLSNSISLSQNDNFSENAVLEASDAGMGIYSDNGGNFGSRLVFGEISSGALSNKWGIIRSTGSQSKLYISYGTSVDVASNAKQLTVQHDGNVGIGTTSPAEKLEINGITLATNFRTTTSPSYSQFIRNGTGAAVYINQVSSASHPILRLSSGTASPNEGVKFTVENDGSVGIGTTTPTHKLEVNGTIRSKEVKVEANGWPDYVFEPDYNLLSLEEIEAFIKSEKHLPEIPSAKEIEANGLMLGEMNRLLLRKIEELTLHLIEVNKENTELRQQLTANSQGQNEKIEELTLHQIELLKEVKELKATTEIQQKEIEKLKSE